MSSRLFCARIVGQQNSFAKEKVSIVATIERVVVQTVLGLDIPRHHVNDIMESDSEEGFGDPEIVDDAIKMFLIKKS